eukprot:scaffold973_cov196-Pinguiococcus_pyrenoidosus.AAC.1
MGPQRLGRCVCGDIVVCLGASERLGRYERTAARPGQQLLRGKHDRQRRYAAGSDQRREQLDLVE